jgi:hypothetical protein
LWKNIGIDGKQHEFKPQHPVKINKKPAKNLKKQMIALDSRAIM